MNTADKKNGVQSGIRAYLGRVDRDLWRCGTSAEERAEILASITTQIDEMLAKRCINRTPTVDDFAAILPKLAPPKSYMKDTPSTSNLLLLLLRRLWIGYPVAIAVNDHGKRKIYWWRLAAFLLTSTSIMLIGMVLGAWLLGIDIIWLTPPMTPLVILMMNITFFARIYRIPVTDLPLICAETEAT